MTDTSTTSAGLLRHVDARTHGRYLVKVPAGSGPWPILLGFHGYGENADMHMSALTTIPGVDQWLVASVQALHPFYTRDQHVVASWMTRQDRELAIRDNVDYVEHVLQSIRAEFDTCEPLAMAGFSQGGAMAYRAAAACGAAAVIVLAADVPPDVVHSGTHLGRVLLGRGTADAWYTEEKHLADITLLAGRAERIDSCVFAGGHEWSEPFRAAAGRLLADLQSRR